MPPRLQDEIKQTKPFGSSAEEAILNIYRTASVLEKLFDETLKPHGLTEVQYNALRILRGAGKAGLACQEIADRMITRDPDVTRLIDRLATRSLVERSRSEEDRRVVVTRISPAGLKMLSTIDEAARKLPQQAVGHLGEKKLQTLIDLLEEARNA